MSYLVEKLRNHSMEGSLMAEAADRIEKAETERNASDLALQAISLALGGPDEWSDQETMISDVKRRVVDLVAGYGMGSASHEVP